MAFFADRVKETTTTTGTGSLTLGGTATGFRTFTSALSNGDLVYYAIDGGAEWEVGLGTFTAPATLARTSILASSNAGAVVNLSAGTKIVFCDLPATVLVGTANQVFRYNSAGTAVGFGTIAGAGIANGVITSAHLADMVQATVKGRAAAAGTGVPGDLTAQQIVDILNTLTTLSLLGVTTSNFGKAGVDIGLGDGSALQSIFPVGNAKFDLGKIGNLFNALRLAATAYLAAATTAQSSLNMPAGTAPTSPTEGDVWNDDTQDALVMFVSGIKQILVGLLFTQTADKTVVSTNNETTIIGTGVGSLTLPANFWEIGKAIRIKMAGVYSTVSVTGDTVTVRVKYGTTVLALKATTALVVGATNLAWIAEVLIICRTTGASGTVQVGGAVQYQIAANATVTDELNHPSGTAGGGTATINTTTSNAMDVTVQHSASNASNSVKSHTCSVEVLN